MYTAFNDKSKRSHNLLLEADIKCHIYVLSPTQYSHNNIIVKINLQYKEKRIGLSESLTYRNSSRSDADLQINNI